MIPLKRYQERAVDAVVAVLGTPSAGPRCVLLEAPTGAGKTLVAGSAVSELSEAHDTLWLWFAPFGGLVEQSASFLRGEFGGLRVRDVITDRALGDVRPGDVYVTTWQAVAARNAEGRRARTRADGRAALDEIIAQARDKGWRIGAVVDEAHHGFVGAGAKVALEFFRDVLNPDITVLVTATPDDADIERFRRAARLPSVQRLTVSRADAVAAGLVKPGVRAVSFAPKEGTVRALVDFERTALRAGADVHHAIKRRLGETADEVGAHITPLLLVQVDSSPDSVARARAALETFGFSPDAIAVHTNDEPDPHLLGIAHDERVEVLIFKMAVALGFDAPRAWTLVSLRRLRDVDFGIQIVGRVLRVDRRLHGRDLPPDLASGYVFVADPDVQDGLVRAADAINRLRTDLERAAPDSSIEQVEVGEDGAVSLPPLFIPEWRSAATHGAAGARGTDVGGAAGTFDQLAAPRVSPGGAGSIWEHAPAPVAASASPTAPAQQHGLWDGTGTTVAVCPKANRRTAPAPFVYPFRPDLGAPRRFDREVFPDNTKGIAAAVAARIDFEAVAGATLSRRAVEVVRNEIDLFAANRTVRPTAVMGDLDVDQLVEAGRQAVVEMGKGQQELFGDDYVSGRSLLPQMVERLREVCREGGLTDWLASNETLEQAVLRVVGTHPHLLRQAVRSCLAEYVDVEPGEEVPEALESPVALPPSARNVYGVIPPGLNQWERDFVRLLDNDLTGTVLWWHRNEPRKDHAVVVCASGTRFNYYPDFVVGVRGRLKKDGILLAETKLAYGSPDSMAKARADHRTYGNIMMLTRDPEGRWWTVRYDADRGTTELDKRFQAGVMMVGF